MFDRFDRSGRGALRIGDMHALLAEGMDVQISGHDLQQGAGGIVFSIGGGRTAASRSGMQKSIALHRWQAQ